VRSWCASASPPIDLILANSRDEFALRSEPWRMSPSPKARNTSLQPFARRHAGRPNDELAVHDGLFEREHGSNSSRGGAWPGPATRRCRPSSAAHAPCRQALCSPKRPKGDRQQSASRSRRANGLRERRSSRAGAGPGTTPTTPHRLTRRSGAVRLRGVRAVAGPRRTPRRPPRQRSIADGGFLKP
jgi:hypothetical protein